MDIKDFCSGIQHLGIPTNDIEKTIRFYEQLGFKVALNTSNNGEAVAFLQKPPPYIETKENRTAVMRAGAIDHIALDVKNIDALFELVKTKQFPMLDEQVNSLPFWENGVKFFTIVGPNKEKIEFCEKI